MKPLPKPLPPANYPQQVPVLVDILAGGAGTSRGLVWFILGIGESRIELELRVVRTFLPLFIIMNTHLEVVCFLDLVSNLEVYGFPGQLQHSSMSLPSFTIAST